MAEAALVLDNNSQDQAVADLLRQQKNQERLQQSNAEMVDSQVNNSNINDRLMSRVASGSQEETASKSSSNKKGDAQETAETLKKAKQLAKLAANPTVAGVAKVAAQQTAQAVKQGELGKKLTGELLKQSWTHLADSFGLTLIYLNIHAWVGFLEGHKIFCKLGEETKTPGKLKSSMGMLEMMGIIGLDFLVFCIILGILAIINVMVDALVHPTRIFGALWDLLGISF